MVEARILVVDDNKSVLSALEILLQFEYSSVTSLFNPNQIPSFPKLEEIDIVLLDMNFSAGVNSGNEGLYWLREIKKRAPNTSVIMMTAYGAVDLAVRALKEGASDFVLKPWNNERLLATVKSAHELGKSRLEVRRLKARESELRQLLKGDHSPILGRSKALASVMELVAKVAKTGVNVLVTGENGTGKELIARELHRLSPRKEEVFTGVDMGALADTLFESELFGHVKGAFTDAKEDRSGKFEAAHRGTLFLDEIGNLSLPLQAKLLSSIQNRAVVRVGSNSPVPVDIRLICATNGNLEQMVADGLFREDLLYRINTIQIELPPLRDREGDVLLLADHFLHKFAHKYDKPGLKINAQAREKLMEYPWPGNVRELQHTLERAVILSDGSLLKPADFLLHSKPMPSLEGQELTLEEMEQRMIQRALDQNGGNYSAAAQRLGISRQTLYNKLKKRN